MWILKQKHNHIRMTHLSFSSALCSYVSCVTAALTAQRCVAEVDWPAADMTRWGWPLRLTAECLCLFPVPDNSSMQRGRPPGPAGGHQSRAHRGQALWKCPEHSEAPNPRLSHPVIHQLSAAAQWPLLLLTAPLWDMYLIFSCLLHYVYNCCYLCCKIKFYNDQCGWNLVSLRYLPHYAYLNLFQKWK